MKMHLTPKQLHILTRIRDLRIAHGCSPTMQELADELDVSKVTVFEHVEALIKKGALRRQPNKARSLEVSSNVELPDEQRGSRVPLVGRIAAGQPIEAVEEREFLDLRQPNRARQTDCPPTRSVRARPRAASHQYLLHRPNGCSATDSPACLADRSTKKSRTVATTVPYDSRVIKPFALDGQGETS